MQQRKRGRPRTPGTDEAALAAARQIVSEHGVAACTLTAVAERIGVGKPALYRRWPSRGALLYDALLASGTEDVPVPDTGSVRGDLAAGLPAVVHAYRSSPYLEAARAVLTGALADEHTRRDLAARWAQDRIAVAAIFERGNARGERVAPVPPEFLAEVVNAWLLDRCFHRDEPPNDEDIAKVIDLCAPPGP